MAVSNDTCSSSYVRQSSVITVRRHAGVGISYGPVSVCTWVSVTRRYCIETATRTSLNLSHTATEPSSCISNNNGFLVKLLIKRFCDAWPASADGYIQTAGHRCPLIDNTSYCSVTEAHVPEQLARGCYPAVARPGVEPATVEWQVRRAAITAHMQVTVSCVSRYCTEIGQLRFSGVWPLESLTVAKMLSLYYLLLLSYVSLSDSFTIKLILILELLFLPISTIESAVGKRLITHCCVSRLARSRLSGHIEPHSPRLQA